MAIFFNGQGNLQKFRGWQFVCSLGLRPTPSSWSSAPLSVALGTLLATAINVSVSRQVDILLFALNKEACELRLLRAAC